MPFRWKGLMALRSFSFCSPFLFFFVLCFELTRKEGALLAYRSDGIAPPCFFRRRDKARAAGPGGGGAARNNPIISTTLVHV